MVDVCTNIAPSSVAPQPAEPVAVRVLSSSDPDYEHVAAIRRAVFIEEQGCSAEEEFDEADLYSRHLLALYEGEACGTARWRTRESPEGIKLERFAVLTSHRNKGIGRLLVQTALSDVFRHKGKSATVYLHAQLPAISLYERAGFEAVGPIFLECDIKHKKMVMKAETLEARYGNGTK